MKQTHRVSTSQATPVDVSKLLPVYLDALKQLRVAPHFLHFTSYHTLTTLGDKHMFTRVSHPLRIFLFLPPS